MSLTKTVVSVAAAKGKADALGTLFSQIVASLVFIGFGCVILFLTVRAKVLTELELEEKRKIDPKFQNPNKLFGYGVGSILVIVGLGLPVYAYMRYKAISSSRELMAANAAAGVAKDVGTQLAIPGLSSGRKSWRRPRRSSRRSSRKRRRRRSRSRN